MPLDVTAILFTKLLDYHMVIIAMSWYSMTYFFMSYGHAAQSHSHHGLIMKIRVTAKAMGKSFSKYTLSYAQWMDGNHLLVWVVAKILGALSLETVQFLAHLV